MLFVIHSELPVDSLDLRPRLLGNIYYINFYIYKFVLNNENLFSAAAALNPKASGMYGTFLKLI